MKYSSYEKQQKLFENFRRFLKEEQEVQFETNDFCTEFPEACSGVLGTKRATMPQVPDVGEFEKDLKSAPPEGIETNEPEKIPDIGKATRDYLNSSDDLGEWPGGDQVQVETIENIDPAAITPTQKDIYMDNALSKVAAAEAGKWFPWKASVLVSDDNFLLDGHHRWAATIIYNKKHPNNPQKMTIEKVKMPIKQLLKVANAYTDAAGGKRHSGGGTTMESVSKK